MYSPVSPSEMRQIVLNGFQQHRGQTIRDQELHEHVRIEEGKIVAYCYQAADLFAMWMVQIGLVQFYNDRGAMLQTLELKSHGGDRRRAA